MTKGFKHLTWHDRLKIAKFLKLGYTNVKIAGLLRVHNSTISREVRRGTYDHLDGSTWIYHKTYSPDLAQERYDLNKTAKGGPLKIGNDHALAEFIEHKIAVERYSPAATLAKIKGDPTLKFNTSICIRTLYSYISNGVFLRITNKNLPMRGERRKQGTRKVRPARASAGDSIEKRPEAVNNRTEFGHREMDTVVGTKRSKACLLVLTERQTRHQLTMKMPNKTTAGVVSAIDRIERKCGRMFPQIFKSVTMDNGSEFADCVGFQSSIFGGVRTNTYYCHPYSSWERGSNEKQNGMLRRWFPKGTDFAKITANVIQNATRWLNDYPRKLLDWGTSRQAFERELARLNAGVRCFSL